MQNKYGHSINNNGMTSNKILIFTPTYNEAENIENLLEEISNSVDIDELEILVVDDNSPDKTWEIVKNYETKLERPKKSQIFIKVIRREKKRRNNQCIIRWN